MRISSLTKTIRLFLVVLINFSFLISCSSDSGNESDVTAPVITINGDNPLTLEQNTVYIEAGASAVDDIDGNILVDISNSVDTSTIGEYIIIYNAMDAAGNASTVTRVVNVVQIPDNTPPAVTINGETSVSLIRHTNYVDAGATAIDDVDGSVSVSFSGSVDVSTIGTYTITYSATDSAGNIGAASRTVNVVPDTLPPEVTLNGDSQLTLIQHANYVEPGAAAFDNVDGTVEVLISGSVNVGIIGSYVLTYSAIDAAGNTGTETRAVNIVAPPRPFVTRWKTDNFGLPPSNFAATGENQIKIDTIDDGYNYHINWGDGQTDYNVTGDIIHTYAVPGIYTVSITGDFPRIYFSEPVTYESDNFKLLSVEQWGDIKWQSMNRAFYYCQNLIVSAHDAPDLSQVTDVTGMFANAKSLNQNINHWDVSSITDMTAMFYLANNFNQDLSAWDVSSVRNMRGMFGYAYVFNQDLSTWDVSSVTNMNKIFAYAKTFNQDLSAWDVSSVNNMSNMFQAAYAFNQDIGSWDVSSVTNMRWMFNGAISFNQNLSHWNVSSVTMMTDMFSGAKAFNRDLSAWDVSSVRDMNGMFGSAIAFNQELSTWDVSSVWDMSGMFWGAQAFNQDISAWDVSSVTNMSNMFMGTKAFNQNIGNWDVYSVTDMSSMFYFAESFNQDLSAWNVSSVTNMWWMFHSAGVFNQDISTWDVSSVTDMSNMFRDAAHFNQDIGDWDVSSVTDMYGMFWGATSFNQDLGGWNVTSVIDMYGMFAWGAGLSTSNYDSLLIGWSMQSLRYGVTFDAGISKYSSIAQTARDTLTKSFHWTVTDGGLAP